MNAFTSTIFIRYLLFGYFIIFFQPTSVRGMFKKKQSNQRKPDQLNAQRRSSKDSNEALDVYSEEETEEMHTSPNIQLSKYIKARARPYRRPVLHSRDLIEVHVRSSLYQIVDLDQRNNLATLSAYFDVWWMDAFIPWNISDFDGITHTFVPVRWIWKPEFYLYHSIQGRTPEYDASAMVEVRQDGLVRLFVPITSRALCPINGLIFDIIF